MPEGYLHLTCEQRCGAVREVVEIEAGDVVSG